MSVCPGVTTQLPHHQEAPRITGIKLPGAQHLPCHDNEEIQPVPCIPKVALLAKNAQGHHLQHHLHGKEDKDEVIEDL